MCVGRGRRRSTEKNLTYFKHFLRWLAWAVYLPTMGPQQDQGLNCLPEADLKVKELLGFCCCYMPSITSAGWPVITDLLSQKIWPLWTLTLNQEELVKTKSRPVQKLVVSLTESMNRIKTCEEKKKVGVGCPPDKTTENTKTEWGMQEIQGPWKNLNSESYMSNLTIMYQIA